MDKIKEHLLIVDDEPHNRELLRRLLGSKYTLSEAGDVTEAVSVLESQQSTIKLILCDYLMPGMNGTELATIVQERWPGTRFVLLTGYDEDEEIAQAQERGDVHQVITKPWRTTELRAAIIGHLEQ